MRMLEALNVFFGTALPLMNGKCSLFGRLTTVAPFPMQIKTLSCWFLSISHNINYLTNSKPLQILLAAKKCRFKRKFNLDCRRCRRRHAFCSHFGGTFHGNKNTYFYTKKKTTTRIVLAFWIVGPDQNYIIISLVVSVCDERNLRVSVRWWCWCTCECVPISCFALRAFDWGYCFKFNYNMILTVNYVLNEI